MPIDVVCNSCGQRMRVADTYAGKKAKCPKCQGVIQIPGGGGGADAWYVQTSAGQQYGPITRAELEQWVAESRVDSQCQLLQDGWEQWKWADEVFPQVGGGGGNAGGGGGGAGFNVSTGAAGGGTSNPFAAAGASASANPFAAPQTGGMAAQGGGGDSEAYTQGMVRALQETRPWVMFLSILGFIGGGLGTLAILISLLALMRLGAPGYSIMSMFLMLCVMVAYIAASYYLFKYGQAILTFIHTRGGRQLETALEAQRTFWKIIGILTAIFLVLYILLFLYMFMVGGPTAPNRF